MKKLILLFFIVCVSGCSMASIESTTIDNQPCNASYFSLFKSSDDINMSACGGEGNATGSQSDALSQAILGAVVKGMMVAP